MMARDPSYALTAHAAAVRSPSGVIRFDGSNSTATHLFARGEVQ
jgi:hypothetical protein